MSTPEFRLHPWEHRGIEPAPARTFEARIEGQAQRFDVRWREERIYFRLAGGDDERVWMLQNECSWPDSNFESLWRAEVEAGRVARFFVVERAFSTQSVTARFERELQRYFHPSNLNLFGPTTFAVAASDEGMGWAQEWCGGSWVAFPLPARTPSSSARRPSIWHHGWNAAKLRRALSPLAGDFAFRLFGREGALDEPPRWARGSQGELERLFRAAGTALIGTARGQNAARFGLGGRASTVRVSLSVYAETAQAGLLCSNYPAIVPDELVTLFLEHNLLVGGSWKEIDRTWVEYDENDEPIEPEAPPPGPPLRINWDFTPHTLRLEFEVEAHPSAHEQLEARLTLRDWLRERVSGEEMARLTGE